MPIKTVIGLPPMSAAATASLSTAMVTAAEAEASKNKKGVLPDGIEPSRQRLIGSLEELQTLLTPVEPEGDEGSQRSADQVIDNAWGANFDWLTGWTRVPSDDLDAIKRLHDMLFSEGLGFLTEAYKTEFEESDARLRALTPEHEALYKKLGGTLMLAHLREAHAAYGAALGITEVKATPAKVAIKAAHDACQAALRAYIAKVAAYDDVDIEGSSELVAALLKPYLEFKRPKRRKAPADPKPAPPSPTPAAAKKDKEPPK